MSEEKTRREALELFRIRARPVLDAVLGLADHLESIEALDQAATEAVSRREAADRDLAACQAEIAKLNGEAAGILSGAKAEAAAMRTEAAGEAEGVLSEARDSAVQVRATARVDAANIIQAAERKRDDVQAEVDRLQAQVTAARDEIATLAAQRDEINAQIEAARAAVGKLMGG